MTFSITDNKLNERQDDISLFLQDINNQLSTHERLLSRMTKNSVRLPNEFDLPSFNPPTPTPFSYKDFISLSANFIDMNGAVLLTSRQIGNNVYIGLFQIPSSNSSSAHLETDIFSIKKDELTLNPSYFQNIDQVKDKLYPDMNLDIAAKDIKSLADEYIVSCIKSFEVF